MGAEVLEALVTVPERGDLDAFAGVVREGRVSGLVATLVHGHPFAVKDSDLAVYSCWELAFEYTLGSAWFCHDVWWFRIILLRMGLGLI